MVNYTPVSTLPYPAMSDPPNGPEQILALATALEPRIINRFANALTRSLAITAPSLGMITFRDDARIYEYWTGAAWEGIDASIAMTIRASTSTGTDRAFTTTESPALVQTDLTITNPSSTYRLLWLSHSEFSIGYSWTTSGLQAMVRHYMRFGATTTAVSRSWSHYSASGVSTGYSGAFPVRAGFLAPSASLVISSWITIEKTNSTTGTLTMTSATSEQTIFGVTTV